MSGGRGRTRRTAVCGAEALTLEEDEDVWGRISDLTLGEVDEVSVTIAD